MNKAFNGVLILIGAILVVLLPMAIGMWLDPYGECVQDKSLVKLWLFGASTPAASKAADKVARRAW